jgi:hypothetical protein
MVHRACDVKDIDIILNLNWRQMVGYYWRDPSVFPLLYVSLLNIFHFPINKDPYIFFRPCGSKCKRSFYIPTTFNHFVLFHKRKHMWNVYVSAIGKWLKVICKRITYKKYVLILHRLLNTESLFIRMLLFMMMGETASINCSHQQVLFTPR